MSDQEETREGSRIAKVMARAGLCSRRDAEVWIAEGRVSVNGEVLTSPAFNVSETDDVRVDGQPLRAPERTRLFAFHKPRGLVTTAKDPEGRPTLFDALPPDLPRVVTIGRLDINTEGLILLTNDGGLARVLELPSTGWLRRYRVRAHGEVTQEQLDALRDGVTIDGVDYLGIEAKFERQQGSNVWLTMGLREGKNREIKRVLEHMGLSVNRLIRVSFGPFELGDLPEGELYEVRTKVLRDQLGPKLAKQAGANFDAAIESAAPVPEPPRGDRPLRRPGADKPERDEATRKRKHVSVLREEAREDSAGPRKRITRATTADRKGREVKVERVSLASPPPPEPPKRARRAPGEGFSRDHAPRRDGLGERRVAARSGEERPRREHAARDEGARARDDRAPRRDERPRRAAAEHHGRGERDPRRETPRPLRGEGRPSRESGAARDGNRPARAPREGFGDRAPRGEGRPARAPREGFSDRAPRGEGRPARAPREGYGDRAPRGEGRPARAPREGFGDRAPRGEGRPARAPREGFGDRAPRGEGRPARAPREGFGDRAPRGEGRPARAPREGFGERAPRGEGRPARAPREGFGDRAPREGRPARAPREGFGERAPRGEGRPARAPRENFGERAPREGRPARSGPARGKTPGGGKPGPRGGGRPPRPR
jgi:23S rRNA pseudouridine2605 synthase